MFTVKFHKMFIVILLAALLLIPSRSIFAQSATSVPVGIFAEQTISPDTRVEIPIEVKNVNGLYALDIAFEFDPAILQAEDVDPVAPGVQMALGNFLDPGMVLYNTIDNEKGTAHFVMTQVNPSEPKTGNGILLVVYFKAVKQGKSALTLTNAQLSTRDGLEIATSITNSSMAWSGCPGMVATSIPVQDASLLTQIPTEHPTSTATIAPRQHLSSQQKKAKQPVLPTQLSPNWRRDFDLWFSFAASWWIVLILFILVLAAAILIATKRKKHSYKKIFLSRDKDCSGDFGNISDL